MKFDFFKKSDSSVFKVVILAVIFGFLAGIVGQIIATAYINPWSTVNPAWLVNSNLSPTTSPAILELGKVKKIIGLRQDSEVSQSVDRVSPAVVGIYLKKPANQDILDQIYLAKDLKGSAFILTSDGWLVSFQSVVEGLKKEQLVIIYDNNIFSIDKIIKDKATGAVFIKITANDLPVVTLGDSDELLAGQLVITLSGLNEVVINNIKDLRWQLADPTKNLILSTENFNQLILLQNELNSAFVGGPLVSSGGEVVGLIKITNDDKQALATVIPLNQIRPIISGVLKDGLVKRPYLGVNYLDLTQSQGLDKKFSQNFTIGALVINNPLSNTPAAAAEIKAYDVISKVEDQTVNQDNNLSELIQQYRPGENLNLEIQREGKTLIKKIILSVLPQ